MATLKMRKCVLRTAQKKECAEMVRNEPSAAKAVVTNLNHYLELDMDNDGDVYLSIHCGSRNLGKQVAEFYQNLAVERRDERVAALKEACEKDVKRYVDCGEYTAIQDVRNHYRKLIKAEPPKELCYLEGMDMANYLEDMGICNDWAKLNHRVIYNEIYNGLHNILGW